MVHEKSAKSPPSARWKSGWSGIISDMRRIDSQDELQGGIAPVPGPSPQPDGLPGFEAKRPELPPRPRLCEQGPCRHYHRLEIQVESADPRAQRVPVRLPVLPVGAQAVPDGTLYQAPATFHTSVSHYCYPDVGIEMTLGDTPVVRCNRWDPMDDDRLLQRSQERFLGEERGREYTRQVEAWEAARAKEANEAAEADSLIADSLIEAQLERYGVATEQCAAGWRARMCVGNHVYASDRQDQSEAVAAVMKRASARLRELYRDGVPFPEPIKESK